MFIRAGTPLHPCHLIVAFHSFVLRGSVRPPWCGVCCRRIYVTMAEAPSHYVECLPFECYVLRSFMDTRECVELAARIAQLADGAMPPWRTIATTQDHPLIAISHNANQTRRSRACERACGLKACTGACGAHVGVLTECPKDIFDLAQRCAQQINDTIGGTPLPPFRPTHFWALLYGQQGRQNAMAPHLDRPVGWTLSVCVGGDATCTVGCPPAKGS